MDNIGLLIHCYTKKAVGTSPYHQFIYQTIVLIDNNLPVEINISEIVRILGIKGKWQKIVEKKEAEDLLNAERIIIDIIYLIFDEMSKNNISFSRNNLDVRVMQIITDL